MEMEFVIELQHMLNPKRHLKVPLNKGTRVLRKADIEINRKGSS